MYKMLTKLKMKTISMVVIVLMLIFLVISLSIMLLIRSTGAELYKQTVKNDEVLINAFEVYALKISSSTYLRAYLMNDDLASYDKYIELNEGENVFDESIAKFIEQDVKDEVLTFLYSAKDLESRNVLIEIKALELYRAGDRQGARDLYFGNEYTSGLSTILERIFDFEEAVMHSNEISMKKASDFQNNLIVISTVLMFLFLILLFLFIISLLRIIIKSLGLMGKLFAQLGDGDLRGRVPSVKSNNEIFSTYNLINDFVVNVSDTLKEVSLSTDEVASGNNELAVTTEELSTTFSSQSEQVTGAAGNMEQISDKLKNVVEMLQSNTEVMENTVNSTEKGQSRLLIVKEAMKNINQQTDSLSSTIIKLSDSSAEIGNIITVINDIADQTNLLALNAAIEAARAGEAGRGFAVVADEVRKLAERTQKATSEIEQIISTLQQDSELASTEMRKASTTVLEGAESIEVTETAFNEIFDGVNQISETSASINVEVSQNYDLILATAEGAQMVAAGIEESTSAVAEFTSTVGHLQKRVEMLKNKLSFFILSDDLDRVE